MDKITGIIVVKNNPQYLFKTINSIQDIVEKIIIIDIGINDQLIKKLENYKKIKIVKIKEEVPYVELIREKTKKFADTEYILFIDPDEEITPLLKKTIKNNYKNYDYIKIPRKNIIFGKWIKYSRWWPDYQIRLFKKEKIFWPKILHGQPKTNGKCFEVEAKEEYAIIHYNYKNLDEYLEKARRYAKAEAQELIVKKINFSFTDAIKKSLNEFISRYFAFEGYKDGLQGFILSFLQMFYYFLVYFYYLEINNFKNNDQIKPEIFFKQGLKESIYWKKNKSLKEKILSKII